MFFNLKEAAEHGVNVGTNWSSYSHSAIRFDESQTTERQSGDIEYVESCVSITLSSRLTAAKRSYEDVRAMDRDGEWSSCVVSFESFRPDRDQSSPLELVPERRSCLSTSRKVGGVLNNFVGSTFRD